MKKKISRILCLGAVLYSLSGCGETAVLTDATRREESVLEENIITYQLLDQPELDYEVPEMLPGLCVPSGGYDVDEEKYAHVYGRFLPEKFYLLEKESGNVMYTGTISDVTYHKDTGSYTGVADFSEFAKLGEFVLQCDYLGYSYPFTIEENLQENTLLKMLDSFPWLPARNEDLQSNVDAALVVLLAYDFYGQVDRIAEGEIPIAPAAVHKYVETLVGEVLAEESDAEYDPYMMAALLAKYGHIYRSFDMDSGKDAIKLAKKLWQDAEQNRQLTSEYRILASAELYRATGTYSYRKLVQDHFSTQIEDGDVLKNHYEVLAALTHFKTDFKVKRTLCNTLMDEILKRVEAMATYSSLDNQLLSSNQREEKLSEIMWNMVYLSIVEYVITNYEYGELLESQYFYLQGRNPDAYDYVNELIVKDPRLQASYVLMLYEHLAHEHLE